MKKVRQKKVLGAVISGIGSIVGSSIQAHNQRILAQEQQDAQTLLQNQQNVANQLTNMNQLANTNNDWAYDKFRPIFKCGGKRRMKASLGKYKSRFDK